MDIVFCADRRVLPGLHVAAYSMLNRISPAVPETNFHLFSDDLDETDLALLRKSLAAAGRKFTFSLHHIDAALFVGFPPLNGTHAAYYRLVVPQSLSVERFLYVDADTLCDVDVSELGAVDMTGRPAGWVPEATLSGAVDRAVAEQLGNRPDEFYFNSGVILVNVAEWRRQRVTEKCMDYIAKQQPLYHDQSALNVVLHRNALVLDEKFNCITNMRKHWPALSGKDAQPRLLHFVDYPKPWDFLGEWVNPYYRLWRATLDQTAMKTFRSWHKTPARKFPRTAKARNGYKKALKDSLLFAGYSRGWIKQVKGVPQVQ